MTKETYDKAAELFGEITILQAKIDSYVKALAEQTLKSAYSRDELSVRLDNGESDYKTVFVPRQFVIEMLDSAIDMYQNEKAKLQAELDAL